METNKKLNLEELKELVFNKNQATKQNKDKLFKLAKSNEDIETIEKLANEFEFKNAKIYLNKRSNISLEDAIKRRDFELFKEFVEDGADISKVKVSELIDKKYDDKFIRIFIEKGFYVNIAQLVKKNYKVETIKLALENGAKVDDIYENLTGLAHSSQLGRTNIVELLLQYKPNINKKYIQGFTALWFALAAQHNNIIKLLLENGADIESKLSQGFTPLIQASSDNNIDTVDLLLKYGANVNAQSANKGTALMFAIMNNNNLDMVKLLLKYKANPNIKESNEGLTALDWAEINQNSDIANILINNGAKKGEVNYESIPKLIDAIINYDFEKADALLESGHNIDEEFNNITALIQYSSLGNLDIVNLLLDYGANPNFQTKQGFTALIFAVQEMQVEVVKTLVKRGADITIKGYQGLTALDIATTTKPNKIIEDILKSNKRNSNTGDNSCIKDMMQQRVENDYKELISQKLNELGDEDKVKFFFSNISSSEDLLKEMGKFKSDSTPHITRSLKRSKLSNGEMSKDIVILSVGTYAGNFIHENLNGIKFSSIKTNIGYFLDFPYHSSVSNPYTNNKLLSGIDWNKYIGMTIKSDTSYIFLTYSNHIFLHLTEDEKLKSKSRYGFENDKFKLLDEVQEYNYKNIAMYDEFLSLAENCYDNSDSYYFEKFFLDNCQYLDVDKLHANGSNTALLSTSWRGALEAVRLLVSWGADVNFQNKEGYTPLMLATDRGHYEVCKVLLENGANPNIKNFRGQDSITFAVKNMNPQIIMLFEDYDIDIESIKQYIVNNDEQKYAVEISEKLEQILQTKEKILEFLIFALDYNYEYELDIDYYIENNKEYLVSMKPTRETRFNKSVVDLYFDLHNIYLKKINNSDESKNNIRIKVFEILMVKYQLGKYENARFDEIEGEEYLHTIKIISNEISGEIDVFDSHITLKLLKDNKKTSFEYKKQSENHYINNYRGEIIISKKFIIEKDKNGGQRSSKYIKIDSNIIDISINHNPKELVRILSNFRKDNPVKFTTHDWDGGFMNTFKDNYTDFKGFLDVINEEWIKIESNLKVLSENLYKKIYTFLLETNPSIDYSWCSDGDINIGWSSIDGLEEWCNNGNDPFKFKLQKTYTIGDQTISTFEDVIALFKQEIQIRSENDKLEKIFKEKRKELYYFFKKLNIELEMDLINLEGKSFYIDTQVLKSVINKIFKDVKKREKFNKIKVELIEDEDSKFYDLKITQVDSVSGKSCKDMKDIVTGGDSSIIKKDLMHLCDWSIESSYNNESYRINYLTSSSNNEEEILEYLPEGFTHILRFYK